MKKKFNKQSIQVDVQVAMLDSFKGDLQQLPPNQTFKLVIDYPVSTWAIYKIKTGKRGMGLGRLLRKIGEAYQRVYKAEEKYGVWGHYITDLAIEGIDVNYKTKVIRLQVGS